MYWHHMKRNCTCIREYGRAGDHLAHGQVGVEQIHREGPHDKRAVVAVGVPEYSDNNLARNTAKEREGKEIRQ